VFVDGALWRARASGPGRISVGNRVRVESVDGLTLLVSPSAQSDESERRE
jgi:membrane protein implicated in regulation of membrane protease activity